MGKEIEKLTRVTVPALDEVLGKAFKVLDDGFVRVVDYMGTDVSIVQAARTSYGTGTKTSTDDETLIRYLIRHKHTSPFEMCEIKFHVRVPMDCWRQWIRHRTASVNEYSTRYSIAIDSMYATKENEWRMQALRNKQGSEGFLDLNAGKELTKRERELHAILQTEYNKRIEAGVARELARKDLPLSTYTEAYWKIDLKNLLHFLELRMENKAQLEIREYSNIIGEEIVKRWCPMVWSAFKEYQFEPVRLSRTEEKIINLIAKKDVAGAMKAAEDAGFIKKKEDGIKRSLECLEMEDKMVRLGLVAPWK